MFSTRSFAFLRLVFPPMFSLGIVKINWNPKTRRFFQPPGPNYMVYFNILGLSSCVILHFCQTIRFYLSKDFHNLNLLFPFATGTLIVSIASGVMIFEAEGLLVILNMVLQFTERIQSNF